jgi:hypothetical protein
MVTLLINHYFISMMKLHEFVSGVKLITLNFETIIDNGHKLKVHNYVYKRNSLPKSQKKKKKKP